MKSATAETSHVSALLRIKPLHIKFFTGDDPGAHPPTIRANEAAVLGMIFRKAAHALHFGHDAAEMQYRALRKRAPAGSIPVGAHGFSGVVGNLRQAQDINE